MKLLLAEDTRDLNRAVTVLLEHEGHTVDSAFDGEEALDFLHRDSYDCVILDIMMPKKDGLEVLREMRQRHMLVPVLLLTAKAEIDDRVTGLDAGADDYLSKPFAMKELLARVRALTRRRAEWSGEALSFGDVSLDAETFAMSAGNSVRLSIKEFELMQTLILNADVDLTAEHILSHVWKNEADARVDTVRLYISYLRGKLRAVGSRVTIAGEQAFRLSEGD